MESEDVDFNLVEKHKIDLIVPAAGTQTVVE